MTAVSRRVLVADDHRAMLERVAAVLGDEFVVVAAVADGAALVEAEANLRPDVIITDICMPGMSGLEAATRIRQRGSRVPIVCLTACAESDMRQAALDAGVDAYVLKTALMAELVPAVRAALTPRGTIPA